MAIKIVPSLLSFSAQHDVVVMEESTKKNIPPIKANFSQNDTNGNFKKFGGFFYETNRNILARLSCWLKDRGAPAAGKAFMLFSNGRQWGFYNLDMNNTGWEFGIVSSWLYLERDLTEIALWGFVQGKCRFLWGQSHHYTLTKKSVLWDKWSGTKKNKSEVRLECECVG